MINMPTTHGCLQVRFFGVSVIALASLAFQSMSLAEEQLEASLQLLRSAGPGGTSQQRLQPAWKRVSESDISQLPTILRAMAGVDPLAENWIRSAADAVAGGHLQATGSLPDETLERFILDTSGPARGRQVAYEWLVQVDASASDRLLPQLLDDPSLEIRFDAVARLIESADGTAESDRQRVAYRRALHAAREIDQINQCAARLAELGEPVDLAQLMGFLLQWRVIGPFDNSELKGFDTGYPPERTLDSSATYAGKQEQVTWTSHTSQDKYGVVDLNAAVGKHLGAVAYAWTTIKLPEARPAWIRWGTPNASKLWVNGEQVAGFETYHANSQIDQYAVPVSLVRGENTLLIKVCQSELTDSWAQFWQFQLRVTDQLGGAIELSDE